jgi:hypothetical protein
MMKRSLVTVLFLLSLQGICSFAAEAPQTAKNSQNVPVPKVQGPIPVSSSSVIWGHAWNIDLAKAGYAENEYFVSGKANVYQYNEDRKVEVRTPNVPYTTRILVRTPKDPKKFSGNVIVEIINMSRGWDLDVMWQMQHEYILRNGDAYVGVTSKPNAVKALKQFDPVRYASLSWPNPLPLSDPQNCSEINSMIPKDSSRETENGLFWDIFSQVGALLRSNVANRPLSNLAVKYLYAIGYSQSGSFLRTYIDAIDPVAIKDNKPIYDGYLVGATAGPMAINQCAPTFSESDPRFITRSRKSPVIVVMTNTDSMWGYSSRRPDNDAPSDRFRLYEIAGASHGYQYPGSFEPSVEDIKRAGFSNHFAYNCTAPRIGNDFPSHYIYDTVLQDLDIWVRKGIAPPHGELIQVVNGGTPQAAPKLDSYGNAVGGIRTPYVDVPTATYHPEGIGDTENPEACGMSKVPFDHETLLKLYPTHQDYVMKVDSDTDRLVKEGWLLKEDASKIKTEAEGENVP